MRRYSCLRFGSLLSLIAGLATVVVATPLLAQPSTPVLVTQAVDNAVRTRLPGNVHPLARAEFDRGEALPDLPLNRMLLVLNRSPEQESALRKLLDDQQDKSSPNYHKWLQPEEFGKQFGPSDADMQIITSWLQSQGFQVGTTEGRTMLEFSGTASQVQAAFRTSIHKYMVNGEQHWANSGDPYIPSALTPAVAGVLTLHNFVKKPQIHVSQQPVMAEIIPGIKPQITFPPQNGQPAIHALAPGDYATIYNSTPLYSTNLFGFAEIAVVGRSSLFNGGQDVANFRDLLGLSGGDGFLRIVLNGPDPGDLGGDEEAEATLDATWSSAVAPDARINFVVSASTNTTDGVDLSELYIIEHNLADIMTESFGSCELFATDTELAGLSSLAEQAAAQGITYFVSSGDNGAEGCDDPSFPPATHPISVNALASTAFNTAVGGTMFNENGNPSKYWASTSPPAPTALSYIPENVWNESSLSNGLWSSSGGASAGNIQNGGSTPGVAKPTWQSGVTGIPDDGVRDVPDVSLTAAGHDPYLLCLEGSCTPNGQNQVFVFFISGTSASAPSFAGIMALVDDKNGGRQGQANYVLYRLAAAQNENLAQCNGSNTTTPPSATCVFNDATVGNNVVPGEQGNNYQAKAGYDLTTGLGSVNIANLVNNWNSVTFRPTTTTLSLSPTTITHGSPLPFSITVAPTSGSGVPTGDVFLRAFIDGNFASIGSWILDGAGSVSRSTDALPGGNYSLSVHYGGDATFSSSNSDNSQFITVNPEASITTESAFAFDQRGGSIPLTNIPFGNTVFVRADVAGNSGHGVPTGTVTFADTLGNLPGPIFNPVANPSPLNSQGNTSIGAGIINFDDGSHTITGTYNGDPSFQPSAVSNSETFTIVPGFAGVSGPTDVRVASPGLSGATTVGIIASTHFTTAISFMCSGLPAEATCHMASATGQGPNTVVMSNITVTTTAPHTTMLQNSEPRYYYASLLGGLPLAGIFLVATPRRRRSGALLGMMMALALVVTLPSCGGGGGGGGSHQQDPGTPAGTYTVTITATAGSLQQRGTFTLVVQ